MATGLKIFRKIAQAASTREDKLLLLYAIIVFFGGALRKWFIDSSILANSVLLLQLTIPFLFFIFSSSKAISPFHKYPVLRIYFVFLVLQIANPYQLTLYHGIIGLLVYGGFWIGIFYYLSNRHLFHSDKLIYYIIIFAAVEIVLAFIQYNLPKEHFLNRYANEGQEIALVGDSVRVTGTFSYIAGFGSFIVFFPFFLWALIRKNFSLWFITMALLAGGVGAFMTGSRGAVLVYLGYISVLMIALYKLKDIGRIFARLFFPAIIIFAMAFVIGNNPVQERTQRAYTNFMERFERGRQTGEQLKRLTWDFTYFNKLDRFPNLAFGIGTGASYQGAIILFGRSPYSYALGYVEGELPKTVLEGGILYLILKLIMALLVTYSLNFSHPLLRLLIGFTLIYGIPLVFNVHNAAFLLLGIILIDNIVWRQNLARLAEKEESGDLPAAGVIPAKGYPQVADSL